MVLALFKRSVITPNFLWVKFNYYPRKNSQQYMFKNSVCIKNVDIWEIVQLVTRLVKIIKHLLLLYMFNIFPLIFIGINCERW